MANILTSANFIDDCQLSISTITEVQSAFTAFLTKMEVEFMRKVLGVKLYAEFVVAWASTPTTGKWYDLINGGIYETDFYFKGLKSALTYYSYVKYQQSKSSITVANGNIQNNQDHATVINVSTNVISANNNCIDICDEVPLFCATESIFDNLMYSRPFKKHYNILGI
jgi:hypothetical protein